MRGAVFLWYATSLWRGLLLDKPAAVWRTLGNKNAKGVVREAHVTGRKGTRSMIDLALLNAPNSPNYTFLGMGG